MPGRPEIAFGHNLVNWAGRIAMRTEPPKRST